MDGLIVPAPAVPGVPRPYRGRGNRGKIPAIPLRDKTGIAGKQKVSFSLMERGGCR